MTYIMNSTGTEGLIKDYHIAGLAAFLAATFGIFSNSVVVFWISHFPSMQNAFGKLSMNQCLADLLHAMVFGLYFAPTVFFDIAWLKDPQVSRWFGHLQLIFYDACNASHLMVSINRVFAVFYPIHYHTVFTITVANWLNFFVWFSAIVPSYFAYVQADCIFYYNDTYTWTYAFKETQDCVISGWYYDFLKSIITIVLVVVMDIGAFVKCRMSGKIMMKNVTDQAMHTRRKDERHFVTQACLQGLIFTIELITFFVIATFFTNRGAVFACTTMAWILVHAFDGMIAIAFNKEFCRRFHKYRGGSTIASSSQNNETHHPHNTNRRSNSNNSQNNSFA